MVKKEKSLGLYEQKRRLEPIMGGLDRNMYLPPKVCCDWILVFASANLYASFIRTLGLGNTATITVVLRRP